MCEGGVFRALTARGTHPHNGPQSRAEFLGEVRSPDRPWPRARRRDVERIAPNWLFRIQQIMNPTANSKKLESLLGRRTETLAAIASAEQKGSEAAAERNAILSSPDWDSDANAA